MAEPPPAADPTLLEIIEETEEAEGSEKDGVIVGAMDEEEAKEPSVVESEDLFAKDTPSFRCLQQVLMSSSSLMKQKMRFFPPLEDPGLDAALNFVPPDPVIDDTGIEKYKLVCKEYGIVPISRVIGSLAAEELDLKYYGLSLKQVEAIRAAMMLNFHVKKLILEDNWLSPEATFWIAEMLAENNTIRCLNMKECRIGAEGATKLNEGIMISQCLKEIDLSFNSLGDEGIKALQSGLIENSTINNINLSHNHLGDGACEVLATILKENPNIQYLDLSWNNLFSTPGWKALYSGLKENTSLKSLNLSWNTITNKPAVKLLVRFMKKCPSLEHLDLDSNRLADGPLRMIRGGLLGSQSLKSIRLGNNIINPEEALFLIQAFDAKPRGNPFELLDLENVFVNKECVPIIRNLRARGKTIIIGGVLNDYEIYGPDVNKLLFERARFLGMKPKKKKKKRDFGLFILQLSDQNVTKQQFDELFKKYKLKMLDADFRKELAGRFIYKKEKISLTDMKEDYLRRYPDTCLPPPKKKKGKKGKKKKKEASSEQPKSEEAPPEEAKPEGGPVEQSECQPTPEGALEEQAQQVKQTEGTGEKDIEAKPVETAEESEKIEAENIAARDVKPLEYGGNLNMEDAGAESEKNAEEGRNDQAEMLEAVNPENT